MTSCSRSAGIGQLIRRHKIKTIEGRQFTQLNTVANVCRSMDSG